MHEELIGTIIDLEWAMFSDVQNIGGRAWCQDDPSTFRVMRRSQAQTWPELLLVSYRDDLEKARRNSRNLMMEKYARMMQSTHPAEYAEFADSLPPVSERVRKLVEQILAIHVAWQQEVAEKYPQLIARGRPLRTHDDTALATSFETYMRSELRTYSFRTLERLYEHTRALSDAQINGAELVLKNMVEAYGYETVAEANEGA